jgi:DNA-binding winged helix-turn-helix (wHTH) protein/tetratricopeptide (TPR) repeat protein
MKRAPGLDGTRHLGQKPNVCSGQGVEPGASEVGPMNARENTESYSFGPYLVDLRTGLLWKGRAPVALTPKASELLRLLIQHGEAGVTKRELLERLWPDTVVLENNLTVTMSALRKALGESAAHPRYIHTLSRRGYRFVPKGLELEGPEDQEPPPASRPRPRLGAPASEAWAERERDAPFVGRAAELEFLERRLRKALSGAGGVVCITGEPGIGKTWLAERLLMSLEQLPAAPLVARGRCLEAFGSGEAYWPFLEVLDALLTGPDSARVRARVRTFAPTWYLQFPAIVGTKDDLQALRRDTLGATPQRMLRELVDVMTALARERPLVVLIEDLHWADPSSIDLLRLLCQRSREQAWLVLGTFRTVEAALHNSPLESFRRELVARECEELALEPLSEPHVQSYVAARFTVSDLPAELSQFLLAKTEGHPLFLTRLVSLFVERGEICESGGTWVLKRPLAELVLSVPPDVRGTLQRQLDRLAPADRRALAYASVEGEEFSSAVLAALVEEDELSLQERLAPLHEVHGLIQMLGEELWPDGQPHVRYRFSHALYQSVLHESLVSARRAQLHRRAAEALAGHFGEQAPLIAVSLARHFELGGEASRAVHYLSMAGQKAHELLGHCEARKHFSRALALLDHVAPTERDRAAVPLHLARGWVDFDTRTGDLGGADFEAACQRADASQVPELKCEALFAASVLAYFDFRLEDSQALDLRLFEVAEASGNAELMALARISLGCGHLVDGDVDEALRLNEAAGALLGPTAAPNLRASLWFDRGRCHRFKSDYGAALTAFEQSLALYLDVSGTMSVSNYQELARVQANLGQMSAALLSYQRAERLARDNGQEFRLREQPSRVGWIWRELGDVQGAITGDQEAIERARQQGARFSELSHLIDLARDHLQAGAPSLAESALAVARRLLSSGEVRAFPCDLNGARLQLLDAECCLERARGSWADAQKRAEELLAQADRLLWPKYVALARAQLARVARALGHAATARRELGEALQILAAHPVPVVTWKVYAELGSLEAELGGTAKAREAFQAAHEIVRTIAEDVADVAARQGFWSSPEVRAVSAGAAGARAEALTGVGS